MNRIRDEVSMGRVGLRGRMTGGLVSASALGVLAVSAWLRPSDAGHGTHEQLGLMPCSWATLFDVPCPTCGMTTAFSHAAEGDLPVAMLTQPAGAILAMLTATAFWMGLHVAATGSRLWRVCERLMFSRTGVWGLVGLLIGAWVYKMVIW